MPGIKHKTIAVHDGDFHADDVFAVATLELIFEKEGVTYSVIRTRDEEKIRSADYVVDVGGVYSSRKDRYDHHQIEGAGIRENGIPYASFRLIWKDCGKKLVANRKAWRRIDERLAQPIDAGDSGMSTFDISSYGVRPYLISDMISVFTSSYTEPKEENDKNFLEVVKFAKKIMEREIKKICDYVQAQVKVEAAYQRALDKRLIILDESYPWMEVVQSHPEPLIVVYPSGKDKWNVRMVQKKSSGFENRINFPKAWAGLRDEELSKLSSIPDCIFCHRALFLCAHKTKKGAIALANLALEITQNQQKKV